MNVKDACFSYRSFSEPSEMCVSLNLAKESESVLEKVGYNIYIASAILGCNTVILD